MSEDKKDWIVEKNEDGFQISYLVKERLLCGQSDFQKVEVVETAGHGKMLFNDDLAMLSERDEFIYHDMITHVALFTHPNPKRVLVVGGGDGGTAREVLRHENVEYCKMVEIDALVVEACQKHIPQTSAVFQNQKFDLLIEDAVKFMAETDEKFDVILVDSTDPIGPAQPLFGSEFYSNVNRVLNDDGIVISQGESPFYDQDMQKTMLTVLGQFFPKVMIYNFTNMTYPGGFWSFTFASKKYHPIKDFDPKRVQDSGIKFQYYNEELHKGCFALPQFMKENLKGLIKE